MKAEGIVLSTRIGKDAEPPISTRSLVAEPTKVDTSRLAAIIKEERARELSWRDKAVQPRWYGKTIPAITAEGASIDGLSTPMMTLDRCAIKTNLSAMRSWCDEQGVSLAPHGKTTMAPELWLMQLEAGCWAITVANEPQLRVARGAGVQRVILANMFVRPEGLAWLSEQLDSDDSFEFFCWVDSLEAVFAMEEALSSTGGRRPVSVLVEVGHKTARTGVRSLNEGILVAEAVAASSCLVLAGVSGYEGSIAHEADAQGVEAVEDFLEKMIELHRALLNKYEVESVLLSAGGSAFFDQVATVLGSASACPDSSARVVLRSGAYIVHDDGYYRRSTPLARGAGPVFRAGIHGWARVISMPQPGIAYLDAGKRDVPFDDGLPELQFLRRRGDDGRIETRALSGHEIYATNDQHSFVKVPPDSPLKVGDLVRLGLSHPCTAFDKWSLIPVLDDASAETPVVVDMIRTYF